MHLLALDTSLSVCGVVVASDDPPLAVTRAETVERAHGERLMGMIRAAMGEAAMGFGDLDRLAVTVGPGTFTGLRIGVAAARALALATSLPLVGVGNLAVHAGHARESAGPVAVLAVTRAGRGLLYGQTFDTAGTELTSPRVAPPAEFVPALAPDMSIAGSGADILAEAAGADAARIVHRLHEPDLSALCRLALAAEPAGEAVRPLYLRPPDAKPQTSAVARR